MTVTLNVEPDPRFVGCTTFDEVVERMTDEERAALDAAIGRIGGHLYAAAESLLIAERAGT